VVGVNRVDVEQARRPAIMWVSKLLTPPDRRALFARYPMFGYVYVVLRDSVVLPLALEFASSISLSPRVSGAAGTRPRRVCRRRPVERIH